MGKKAKKLPPNNRKYSYSSMKTMANGGVIKRKSLKEYSKLKKDSLLKTIQGFIANLDKLRNHIVKLKLENNWLYRRVWLLEEQVTYLKKVSGTSGNFVNINIQRTKNGGEGE